MQFMVVGDPTERPCDCGITDYGTLYITQWDPDLGDVTEGSLDCHLAGYKDCECDVIDDNHDGTIGRWDVVCQVLYFKDVKFRMVVGSLLITRVASSPLKPESGQPFLFAPAEATTSH